MVYTVSYIYKYILVDIYIYILYGYSPLRLTGTSPHLLGAKGVNASPQPRTTSPQVPQLQLPLRPTPACPAPAWLWGEIALGCLGWFPGGLGDRPTPACLEPDWLRGEIALGCLGSVSGGLGDHPVQPAQSLTGCQGDHTWVPGVGFRGSPYCIFPANKFV